MDRAEATAPGGDDASPDRNGRQADEREREADDRERTAPRRRAVELRAQATSVRERAAQAVEEAEIVLDATRDRLRRAEAALNRAYANAARKRASIARSVKRGEQHPASQQRDFTYLANRVSALRKRTAEAAAQLARTEVHAARILDELAAREPGNPNTSAWPAKPGGGAPGPRNRAEVQESLAC